jgi:hypothetical protein
MFVTNQFITNEFTEVIQKVIREVVNDPSTYLGSKYLPSVALPVRKIRTEVVEASGGLTNEHVPGTNPQYIQSFGTRAQEYTAPFYKEGIHYDEERLLFLRELGNNGRNVRGVQKYIELDIDRLNRRIEARIEFQRWATIFNGGFSYLGKTVSFGVPSFNQATPVGAVWSLDSISANAAANPLIDIRYWLQGGLSKFRKYVVTEMVMNPNTARWILDNANTRSFLTSYGANPALKEFTVSDVLGFLIPGAPKATIYKGWYQTEAVGSGTTSLGQAAGVGQITVSDAIYMIPDGYIFFVAALPGGDKIGEFVEGVHLSSGTVDNPGFGKFLVIDDNTAPGTKGGPANPYLDLLGGVYGGVKLDRPQDLLTAKVI